MSYLLLVVKICVDVSKETVLNKEKNVLHRRKKEISFWTLVFRRSED